LQQIFFFVAFLFVSLPKIFVDMTDQEKKGYTPIDQRTDRELVQSYIFTFTKQTFNVWEKRIMYNIIYDRQVQDYVRARIEEGIKKNDKRILFTGTTSYKIPLSKISEDSGDYKRIKCAFSELAKKQFEYTDKQGVWRQRSFIAFPTIDPYEGCAYFVIHDDIIKIIAAIEKGYRQFNFDIALSLETSYAMRFYEMFSRQDKGENNGYQKRTIEELKELLGVSGYKQSYMFVRRVLDPAKKELDEKANFSFDYELLKSFGSRKADVIQFHVYHIPENEIKNEALDDNRGKALLQKYVRISKKLWDYLLEIGFTEKGIESNKVTLYIAESDVYLKRANGDKEKATNILMVQLDTLKERALKAGERENPQGYIIGTLKKIMNTDISEERAKKLALYNYQNEKRKEEKAKEQQQEQQEQKRDISSVADMLANKFGGNRNLATDNGDF
jgi:hypothetical protein